MGDGYGSQELFHHSVYGINLLLNAHSENARRLLWLVAMADIVLLAPLRATFLETVNVFKFITAASYGYPAFYTDSFLL